MELNELHTPEEQASSLLKVLLGVFVGVLIVALGFFVYQENRTSYDSNTTVKPSGSSTSTATVTDETASWKTYSSKEYGFSFKYPGDWTLSEVAASASNNPGIALARPTTVSNRSQWEAPQNDIHIYYATTVALDVTNAVNKLGAITLDEYISKNTELTKIGSTVLGGVTGVDAIVAGMSSYYSIYAVKNNHLYNFFFDTVPTKDKLTDTEKTIISNFQFMN